MSEPTEVVVPLVYQGQWIVARDLVRVLVCPECGEFVTKQMPYRWLPAWGPIPYWSHVDGEPLCPVITDAGYAPAPEPITWAAYDALYGCTCLGAPGCRCTCTGCTCRRARPGTRHG
jgi:hypothetical protein